MNGPPPSSSPSQIVLARESDFTLGRLRVRPSRLQVEMDGDTRDLQPRIMQVLVALASPATEVVPTQELIARCWNGLSVGDDAISRCIGQLRRLTASWAEPPFEIETIPSVGYRLIARGAAPTGAALAGAAGAEAPSSTRAGSRGRGWAYGGAILAVLLAAAVGVLSIRTASQRALPSPAAAGPTPPAPGPGGATPRVQLLPLSSIGASPAAKALAASISTDIAGFLSESGAQMVVIRPNASSLEPRPALTLGGAAESDGGRLRIRLLLESPAGAEVLWSQAFEGKAADRDGLEIAAARAAGESIYAVLEAFHQKDIKLDAETLALAIRGEERIKNRGPLQEGEARRTFEALVARAPRFAQGHGGLAVALADEAATASGSARDALLAQAEREAHAAIGIDPTSAGAAYDALYKVARMRRPLQIAAAEDILIEGLRAAPDFAFLNMRECSLLISVGRPKAALPFCQRALALRPFAEPIPKYYVRALSLTGTPAKAEQAAETALRRSAASGASREDRFDVAAFGGSAADVRQLLDEPSTAPPSVSAEGRRAVDDALTAVRTGRPADAERAARALQVAAREGQAPTALVVVFLARMGRPGDVLAVLEAAAPTALADGQAQAILGDPALRAVRLDPRFWRLAARTGLTAYWRERRAWPDFCAGELSVAQCRAAADRAM